MILESKAKQPQILEKDNSQIDFNHHTVKINGKRADLTPTEFRLLRCLISKPGQPIPNEELLENVWGYGYDYPELLRLYVYRLRRKIEPDHSRPRYVKNIRGMGYFFDLDEL